MTTEAKLLGLSFVLAVPDAEATARWWEAIMGFRRIAEPPGWVFVRRGACLLRLGSCPDALPPQELGDHQYFGCVEVDSADRYYAEVSANGADILFAPTSQAWGMREFGVRTPDGHRVMFASALAAA